MDRKCLCGWTFKHVSFPLSHRKKSSLFVENNFSDNSKWNRCKISGTKQKPQQCTLEHKKLKSENWAPKLKSESSKCKIWRRVLYFNFGKLWKRKPLESFGKGNLWKALEKGTFGKPWKRKRLEKLWKRKTFGKLWKKDTFGNLRKRKPFESFGKKSLNFFSFKKSRQKVSASFWECLLAFMIKETCFQISHFLLSYFPLHAFRFHISCSQISHYMLSGFTLNT